ncbi:cytochrome P450 [Purpureocillium lavendulum]|uniref:Cytochrome P450 n=1 Tax=Purpureocillium lavendulum TaxID=1247861 RepID=A0AB34G6L8_9HYPO|nr:cytochrome P450 [Purpureocillium lavendulum]
MGQEVPTAAAGIRLLVEAPATYTLLFIGAVLLCRYYLARSHEPSKTSQLMPTYVPLEIGLSTILLQGRGLASYLPFALRRRAGSLFGVTRRHQILYNLPGVDKVFAVGHRTLDTDPLGLSMVLRLTLPVEKGFLNDEAATAAIASADVPGKVGDLLSFSEDPSQQRRWERAAKVVVLDAQNGTDKSRAVELYGQDFLDRNPTLLDDFWKFDNHAFPLLVAGAPKWIPIKSFKEGFMSGEPVDCDADMSDVSAVAKGRNAAYREFDPLVFWFILYIYATPGLVDALRSEVTKVDIAALGRDCPLLKSAMFETFRMANEPTSIRYVARSMVVADGPHQHHLDAGTWISVPHAGIQKEASVFPEPDRFVPDRFLEVDERTGKTVARYGRLKPWGAGVGICKGRTFAEKEILVIASCFITLWDMEPRGGGPWKVPGSVPGTGVARPNRYWRLKVIVSLLRLLNYLFTRSHFRPSAACRRKEVRIPSREHRRFIKAWLYYPPGYDDDGDDKQGGEKKPRAVVVNWHGGGYMLPNLGMDHAFCERLAREADVLVLDADYRKAPEHPFPAPVEDAEDVLRWVASQKRVFDTDRVAVSGFSSGANLALVAASDLRRWLKGDVDIRAVYAFYPGVDFTATPADRVVPTPIAPMPPWFQNMFTDCYVPRREDRSSPRASPTYAPMAWFPTRGLVFVCSGDSLAPEAEAFGRKLARGTAVEVVRVEGAAHGFDKTIKPSLYSPEKTDMAYARVVESVRGVLQTGAAS